MRRRRWIWSAIVLCGCSPTSPAGGGDGGAAGALVVTTGAGGDGQGDGGGHAAAAGGHGGSAGSGCVDPLPIDEELPELLSQTGLYRDGLPLERTEHARPFEPRYALWSDGADKQRWVYLPICTGIDATDPDDWSLPVGTRLWKEFAVEGVRIETRLIERVGAGPHDFRMSAYVWNDAQTDAVRTPAGLVDAKGTGHDVPDEAACRRCHGSHAKGGGRPSRALGLSAVQLAHDGPGVTLATLAAEGRIAPLPAATSLPPIGDDESTRAALGYLHANCGSCHNHTVDGVPQTDLDLWLDVGVTSLTESGAFLTAVGVPNTIFADPHVSARIEPGAPAASAVWYRMVQRGNNGQMPPIGSEEVDTQGAARIATWIEALP